MQHRRMKNNLRLLAATTHVSTSVGKAIMQEAANDTNVILSERKIIERSYGLQNTPGRDDSSNTAIALTVIGLAIVAALVGAFAFKLFVKKKVHVNQISNDEHEVPQLSRGVMSANGINMNSHVRLALDDGKLRCSEECMRDDSGIDVLEQRRSQCNEAQDGHHAIVEPVKFNSVSKYEKSSDGGEARGKRDGMEQLRVSNRGEACESLSQDYANDIESCWTSRDLSSQRTLSHSLVSTHKESHPEKMSDEIWPETSHSLRRQEKLPSTTECSGNLDMSYFQQSVDTDKDESKAYLCGCYGEKTYPLMEQSQDECDDEVEDFSDSWDKELEALCEENESSDTLSANVSTSNPKRAILPVEFFQDLKSHLSQDRRDSHEASVGAMIPSLDYYGSVLKKNLGMAIQLSKRDDIKELLPLCNKYLQEHPDKDIGLVDVQEATKMLKYLTIRDALAEAKRTHDAGTLQNALDDVDESCLSDSDTQISSEITRARELLATLYRLESYRVAMLTVDKSTIAELRQYSRPPPAVHDVMISTLLILGDHEGKTRRWSECKRRFSTIRNNEYDDLLKRVQEFDVRALHPEIASRVRQILVQHTPEEMSEVSAGASTFYKWAMEMCDLCLSHIDDTDCIPANKKRQKQIFGKHAFLLNTRINKQE